jgi:hypothetical protein
MIRGATPQKAGHGGFMEDQTVFSSVFKNAAPGK